jgi:predicted Zn finger-like uncharacterized protein
MQNTVPCPSCNRELRVPDQLLGKLVKCPACSTTFTANLTPPVSSMGQEASPNPYPPDRQPPPLEDVPEDMDNVEEDENYEPRPKRSRRRRRFYVEHRGGLVLTLGILSLVVCGFLGPVAWIMGNNDLAAMRAGRMDPEGEGLTQAGKICGIIGTIFLILGCALSCLWFVGFGIMAGAGGGRKF